MELLSQGFPPKTATGANLLPLGQKDSFNNSEGTFNLANQQFRKVNQGANNNMSVEIIDDLRHYPANDARRTLLHNRSKTSAEEEKYVPDTYNNRSGNGQGNFNRRPHQEVPREPMRSQREYPQDQGYGNWHEGSRHHHRGGEDRLRGRLSRPPTEERSIRRNYEREYQGPSYSGHSKRMRRY